MKDKNYIRLTSGITALTIVFSLGLGLCFKKNDRFEFRKNKNGEYVVVDNSYIDNKEIKNIYVIVAQNNISEEKQIYIVKKVYHHYAKVESHFSYINIFNNAITYDSTIKAYKDKLEILEETPLSDYLMCYELTKTRYTYKDMQEIYEIIKEDYHFEDPSLEKISIDNILIKKKTLL